MYYGQYQEIRSSAACRALARNLNKQAQELEARAVYLERKRKRFEDNTAPILGTMKLAKLLISHPKFPLKKKSLIREYCRRYEVSAQNLAACVDYEVKRCKHERINQNRITTLIMWSKGKRKVDIARAVGLTKGRITQIVQAHDEMIEKGQYHYSYAALTSPPKKYAPYPIIMPPTPP